VSDTPELTTHRDGYRAVAVAEPTRLSLYARVILGEQILAERLVWQIQAAESDIAQHYAVWRRMEKALAAMLRIFNEGGDDSELAALYVHVDALYEIIGPVVEHPLVAVESEETHARTFLLHPDQYLRVVEDDFTEIVNTDDIMRLIRERQEFDDDEGCDSYDNHSLSGLI
jgi:hypothetical protein